MILTFFSLNNFSVIYFWNPVEVDKLEKLSSSESFGKSLFGSNEHTSNLDL